MKRRLTKKEMIERFRRYERECRKEQKFSEENYQLESAHYYRGKAESYAIAADELEYYMEDGK